MSREQTAEEVRQEYVVAMGTKLGGVFFELRNQCLMLHWKWQEYVALFGTKPERIVLLNKTAGEFFWIVQDTLWDDILLRIARLTDKPEIFGKSTLTLKRLPLLVDASFRSAVEQRLRDCLKRCEFARDWRNRRIAHNDFALALDKLNATPLAAASREGVKFALNAIVNLLNAIQEHYARSETIYDVLEPRGNAVALLYVLRDGLEVEEGRNRRIQSRDLGSADFGPQRPI